MAAPPSATFRDPKATILAILDDNRLMSLATIRPDGWPQVTMVGYAHDDLTLYCMVGLSSQKLENIARDSRVSIAIGHDAPNRLQGLSMSGRAVQVTDFAEIQRLNTVIAARYPEEAVFAPREASCAILRIAPRLISLIDAAGGAGLPQLLETVSECHVHPIDAARAAELMHDGPGAPVRGLR